MTKELQLQQHMEVQQKIRYEKELEVKKVISTSKVKEILGMSNVGESFTVPREEKA